MCEVLHSVGLAAVLVHASVNRMDDIRADRCLRDLLTVVQHENLQLRSVNCPAAQSPGASFSCVFVALRRVGKLCSRCRIVISVGRLTLKTLGTVMVSLVDSPLAEMTVTVGLDMVSRVGVAVVSIAGLVVVVELRYDFTLVVR